MKGSFFRKIYWRRVIQKRCSKISIAPSLLSTKVSTKKKSDVSRNVRRMRSERVNLFFVSLSLCLTKDFLKSPSEKILTIQTTQDLERKISANHHDRKKLAGCPLYGSQTSRVRCCYLPTAQCAKTTKKCLLHPDLPRFILIHPDSS